MRGARPIVLAAALCLPAAPAAASAASHEPARAATILIREDFNPRFGTPIEGFQAYLQLTRLGDRRVLVKRPLRFEQHPARLSVAPGRYRLTRYIGEGGPVVCMVGAACVQQLGPPVAACSNRLALRGGQVLSLLVSATVRDCSIARTR